ncbi:MAG: zinc ABC transporter substrate-binding protein, partial [Actinomycetales bacterium]
MVPMNLRAPLALTIPLALLLSACGSGQADDGRLKVDANFYPYAWVVEQVGGDRVDVTNLTSPGVEPHDLELKPKQVASVQTADLVVFQKGFQSAVDDAVDRADRKSGTTLDVADVVTLASEHDHGVEESEEEHSDEEGHDHEHEDGIDPHVWLDPTNMVAVTKAVGTFLEKADPDHASDYAANATALETRLTDLGESFATGLKTCERDTIVTSHAAFGYLAAKYGLTQVPIAGLDPSNEPSGAQLADITDLVKN